MYLHVCACICKIVCTIHALFSKIASKAPHTGYLSVSVCIAFMRAVNGCVVGCSSMPKDCMAVNTDGGIQKDSRIPSEARSHRIGFIEIYSHWLFKWHGPGSYWAKLWYTCYVEGYCPSLARDHICALGSMRSRGRAFVGNGAVVASWIQRRFT